MSARSDVLARIAAALGDGAGTAVAVPRTYARAGADDATPREQVLDQLVDRLEDYRATVHRCPAGELGEVVAARVAEAGISSLVVPPGVDQAWTRALPDAVTRLVDDPPLGLDALDAAGGTLSACAVAIARTGTLVLDAGAGQGRRALSLVPDWLLVVVRAEQVVPAVPDALPRLDPTRPLTWVSGPSATSDIELERVEGVHGPRSLVVVLVDG